MIWELSVKDLRKAAFVFLVAPLQLLVGILALPSTPSASGTCADIIAAQLATIKAVHGSLACLGGREALAAADRGITTDQELADALPAASEGAWVYVGQAPNGDRLYEVTVDGFTTAYGISMDSNGKVIGIR